MYLATEYLTVFRRRNNFWMYLGNIYFGKSIEIRTWEHTFQLKNIINGIYPDTMLSSIVFYI
jgi:hypothetical protein